MKKYLVILILIGLIGSLVAQMEFYNAYNLSNTYGPSDYLYSYQKNNHYYMTWSEWGSVYFSKSTNSGQDWTSASAVTPDDVIYFLPGVAAKDAMNVYISYSYGSPSNVFLRRSSTGGDSWYPEQNISNTTRMAQNPQVFAEGDTVLVIYEDRDINNKYQIVSVRSTDNGQTFSSPVAISTGNTTSRWPVFTSDNGVIYVVWTKEITDYNNVDLFFSKSTDYGQAWTSQQNISNDSPNGYSRYSIKAMNDKLFLVASSNVTASYNMNEIVFMKSDNGGDTWTTPINISNNEGNSSNPNLAVLSNNDGNYRLYLVWDDKIGTEETEVYLKYSTDNGNNWSETLNVTNSSFPSNKPKIFVENAQGYDDITLVWSEGLTSGGSDVFYKKGRHYLMAFATI
nr:sialidase family protein [Candidatus Cloacimonadota bacterium]